MKKALFILFGFVLLTGCSTNSGLSYAEVSQEELKKDTQSFFRGVKEENGVHLYFDKRNESMFVYLNESNVDQGEEATYVTGFDVKGVKESLQVSYESDAIADSSNLSLDHELFYKIEVGKEYEETLLFHNGKESNFGTISGNN
ncbi:hypothetical protein H0266_15115 [Halobacillus locisalis]|uniref:Lipoprotein n=1 Tax=Halobacillus locisalis TaxID=220753 RepID=A0A838CX91_9BACI|nr:hypothetical protein [Halobacillus locisalis]MBA2176226.1 hypothetical protein [Halobacillus locisalis]